MSGRVLLIGCCYWIRFGFVCFGNGTRLFESKREWGWERGKGKHRNVDRSGTQDQNIDSSVTTLVSAKKIDLDTKDFGDPTNMQIDENISGPTTNVTILPTGLIPFGPTSYTKVVTGMTSKKSVNFRTLITLAGNGAKVAVPLSLLELSVNVKSMLNSSTRLFFFQFSSMDGLDSMLKNGPWFIHNNSLVLKSRIRMSSYVRALIKIRVDVKLKDTIMVAMPKLVMEGFYTYTIRVKYEWKPPRNLSQAPRGVLVGPNVGFKPAKQVYTSVSKKTNANTSENKKKDVESTKRLVMQTYLMCLI
ncbi:hypothetical protein Tco_1435038 [Tanacetum coccineum]